MRHTAKTLKTAYTLHNPQGVPFTIFATRVRNLGWTPERAGAVPHTPHSDSVSQSKLLYARIETPSVGFDTFCSRLRSNKDASEAALTPVAEAGVLRQYYDLYPTPAVSYRRFYSRVQFNNWDKEKAISTPLLKKSTQAKRKVPTFLGQWYHSNKERSKATWKQFSYRVKVLGWDKEKALTLQYDRVLKSALRTFYDGYPNPTVSYGTFYNRVNMWKWVKETAISTPLRGLLTTIPANQRPLF